MKDSGLDREGAPYFEALTGSFPLSGKAQISLIPTTGFRSNRRIWMGLVHPFEQWYNLCRHCHEPEALQ
jgi:hypothetical protein